MENKDIRKKIVCSGLKYWQIAKVLGCTPSTFSCKLRNELPSEEKTRIFAIIDDLRTEAERKEAF